MPPPDADLQLGYWIASMDDVREDLKQSLKGRISEKELVWQSYQGGSSIGVLLLHIAHTEAWWIEEMIAGGRLSDSFKKDYLFKEFGPGKPAPPAPRKPYQWYFEKMDKVRTRTRKILLKHRDDDLDTIRYQEEGYERIEFSIRWIFYHLIEHEAHHRGQILMLRNLFRHTK
ncbi:MAG: hypothetical protein B6244_00785 [Candidatus Cloacimonetes bacterium 4572_55]|nr:MAG: hypothetical protein B6244_00785 [Candidatus Cloacimonetes bacterium 4572_55]